MTPRGNSQSLSLRISVTDRCDLRCSYCKPDEKSFFPSRDGMLSYPEIARFVGWLHAVWGVSQVRITGGEPLVRPQLEKLVELLRAEGIDDLALTTNGQRLAQKAAALKRAGLRRLNISLDSLRPDVFTRVTGGGALERTLEGIHVALSAGLTPVKLNAVVLRGVNDQEAPELVRFALEHGCTIRFLELMPIGGVASEFGRLFVSSAETRALLRRQFQLDPLPVEPGSTSRNYRVRDMAGRSGVVGFVSPISEPFCHGCRRLRLTADGLLVGCLGRPHAFPIAHLLRGPDSARCELLLSTVQAALGTKRRDGEFVQPRGMVRIGG